jgi:hypothetical protein
MFKMLILASVLCAGLLMFFRPVLAQPQRVENDLDAEISLKDLLKAATENNPAIISAAQSAAASREMAAAATSHGDIRKSGPSHSAQAYAGGPFFGQKLWH